MNQQIRAYYRSDAGFKRDGANRDVDRSQKLGSSMGS